MAILLDGGDERCAICNVVDPAYPIRLQDEDDRWRTVLICADCWPKFLAEKDRARGEESSRPREGR